MSSATLSKGLHTGGRRAGEGLPKRDGAGTVSASALRHGRKGPSSLEAGRSRPGARRLAALRMAAASWRESEARCGRAWMLSRQACG